MTDCLEGKPVIRKRDGRRGQVMFHAHGKRPRVLFDGAADTVPVPVEGLRVVEERSPLTGPGLVQPPRHKRPESPIEHSVREVAERVRPRADKRKARKSRSYLDHVRTHECAFAFLPGCEGPVEAHHFPPKRSGDAFGSDYEAGPICNGHHREVTRRYRIGGLTRDETEVHMLKKMLAILAGWVMREEAA